VARCLGLPDSPFFPIPRLISATVRDEAPDLTPPRPPGFADDGGDRCYVKDCGRAIALLMRGDTLQHDGVVDAPTRSAER
jgi:UDP-glucose 4-epimerase